MDDFNNDSLLFIETEKGKESGPSLQYALRA